jgi:mono/diheme cytochrome c family protein
MAAYAGANLQGWAAPDLAPDLRQGLGNWSDADLSEYLRTGRNRFSNATGPMAEVIEYSTSQLTDGDLHAIATYLKDLPARNNSNVSGGSADGQVMNAGSAIFADQCAESHGADGAGEPAYFPDLKGNPNVQQQDPTTLSA